jgi:hypothetical protein
LHPLVKCTFTAHRKINPPGKLHRQADAAEVVLCRLPDFA